MTPFNVEQFLKGQPVVTRNGIEVNMLREIKYSTGPHLTALLDDRIPVVWNMQGKCVSTNDPDGNLDLFMTTPVVYHWVHSKYIEDEEPKDLTDYVKVIIA